MINTNKIKSTFKYKEDYEMCLNTINFISSQNEILFIGLVGSQAHGTSTEKSDYDLRIIYAAKKEYFYSLNKKVDSILLFKNFNDLTEYKIDGKSLDLTQESISSRYKYINDAIFPSAVVNTVKTFRNKSEIEAKLDIESYELGHFFNLLEKSDVNAFELLNLTEDCILYNTESFNILRSIADSLLTKETYNSFVAYAKNQFIITKKETRKFRLNPKELFNSTLTEKDLIIKKIVQVDSKNISDFTKSLYTVGNSNDMKVYYMNDNNVEYLIENNVLISFKENSDLFLVPENPKNENKYIRLERKNPLDFCYIDKNRHDYKFSISRFLRNFKIISKLDISKKDKLEKLIDEFNFIFYDPHKITLNDFMQNYVYEPNLFKSLLNKFGIKSNKIGLNQKFCGISQNDLTETYYLFFDEKADLCFNEKYSEKTRIKNKSKYIGSFEMYKGILKEKEGSKNQSYSLESTELRKSAIRKGKKIITKFVYRQDLYSEYCKKYKEYIDWIKYRDPVRFETNLSHSQNMDTKNAAHMIRILEVYRDLLRDGKMTNKRPNREYLLSIKMGKVTYDEVVNHSNGLITEVDDLMSKSPLKDKLDRNYLNSLLIRLRNLTN